MIYDLNKPIDKWFFVKKLLVLLIDIAAMYLTYVVVNYFKSKINVHRNMGAFLLLLFLSFAVNIYYYCFAGLLF